jgi:hypothetical protein
VYVPNIYSAAEVIAKTLPEHGGQRNGKILDLARGLRLNCGITDLSVAREHVLAWHRRALPVIGTKDFDATWVDFTHAWPRVKYPLGMDLVDRAAARVDPEDLPPVAGNYDSLPTRRLIGLCAALAAMTGGKFFLSSHDAALRIGVKQPHAYRLLRMLCADRVLELLDRGNEYRASRYRWCGGDDEGTGD